MRRSAGALRGGTIALLLQLALAAGAPGQEVAAVDATVDPCLPLREAPAESAPSIACLEPGESLTVVERGTLWARVRLDDGAEGWALLTGLALAPPAPSAESPPASPDLARITFEVPFADQRGRATGSAERLETFGPDRVVAAGGVEFSYQDLRLQAQRLEVDRATRDVVASGEVILDIGPRRITAATLEYNLEDRTGRLTEARAFADPDIYFTGSEVEILGEDLYTLKDGVVTSCINDNPGWSFRTKSARIKLEGFARLKNTTMRVKRAPVFYLPYFAYPAKTERSSGLLFPNFGSSKQRGDYLGLAWYQTIGPSYDTTFYLDLYSEDFLAVGNEFRYRPNVATDGYFEAYAIEDPLADELRWKVLWDHTSENLPFGMRGVVRLRDFSDFNFFRDFERDFNNLSIRRLRSSAFATGSWSNHSLTLALDHNEVFINTNTTITLQQLPEVQYRLRSQQLGRLPIYLDLLSSVNYFSIERGSGVDTRYSRADLFPQITAPLSTLPWLSASITAGPRLTWWEDSIDPQAGEPGGGSLTRTLPTASAQVVGPVFSKVFDRGLGPFAKFKHIIEPRWGYFFVDRFDDQQRVQRFDEVDRLEARNVWGFQLINRVLAKPEDEELGGSREILSFELGQAFSLDDDAPLQRSRDGSVTSQEGPINALFRFNPSLVTSVEARASYSTLFSNLASTSLSGRLLAGRFDLGLSWFTSYDAEVGDKRSDQARLSVAVEILEDRLIWGSAINYDLLSEFLQQQRHTLQFTGQCWGFRIDYAQYNSIFRQDYDVRFALSLKNVGTFLDLTGGSRGSQF